MEHVPDVFGALRNAELALRSAGKHIGGPGGEVLIKEADEAVKALVAACDGDIPYVGTARWIDKKEALAKYPMDNGEVE